MKLTIVIRYAPEFNNSYIFIGEIIMPSEILKKSFISSTELAFLSIKNCILTQKFSQGQKLSYGDLEKKLKMSKTPILSAMSSLADEGLVKHIKNRGYFVEAIKSDDRMDPAVDGIPSLPDDSVSEKGVQEHIAQEHQNDSLNHRIYKKIKELILTSKFVPGQKLIYSDLADAFGVSKTPIVISLARLESENYVYLKRNAGYYVKELNLAEVRDIAEAREALELANVDLIMKNYDTIDMAELEKIHKDFVNYCSPVYDGKKLKLNRQFHLRLAKMSRNSLMLKYIQNIYDIFDLKMNISAEFLPQKRVSENNVEHEQIMEALRGGDKARLKQALRKHLKAPVKDIIQYLNVKQD